MYSDLIARKVLSLDELMQLRAQGVVMNGDGHVGDLALLALKDALSKLDASEKECLDLLARVGYAEGAGEEGLRRWELAEERAKALESRLDAIAKIYVDSYLVSEGRDNLNRIGELSGALKDGEVVERQSG